MAHVAPELADRMHRHVGNQDVFTAYRIDEQLLKALDRKVWLPSGGTLVIDRTEAMTVIDVNTGKFTGSGGNLEETVTRNNLEAAEEIVRQLRLRDIGGIIVIDFIDMVLEANRDLVLRRLTECLARDRTRHQVAEVTSLGLVQMTRKRVGGGLLEHFSMPCEHCRGRGVIVATEPRPSTAATGASARRLGAPVGRRGRAGAGATRRTATGSATAAAGARPSAQCRTPGRRPRRSARGGAGRAVPSSRRGGPARTRRTATPSAAGAARRRRWRPRPSRARDDARSRGRGGRWSSSVTGASARTAGRHGSRRAAHRRRRTDQRSSRLARVGDRRHDRNGLGRRSVAESPAQRARRRRHGRGADGAVVTVPARVRRSGRGARAGDVAAAPPG